MPAPLCFVLMPFGKKPDATGHMLDFDSLYKEVIDPAVRAAGLEPLRADEELQGGIIHKLMFERLILCPFAIAEITGANANVFYELGVRHLARPHSTVLMHAQGTRLPFDVGLDRSLPYGFTKAGKPATAAKVRAALTERLEAAKRSVPDSPIYQLLDGLRAPAVAHMKTDLFRELEYAAQVKRRLAAARDQRSVAAIDAVSDSLGDIALCEVGVAVDLFLSYRAVKAWDSMLAIARRMSPPLAATVMVREQVALALNRLGRHQEAEDLLMELIAERGPSSETYGILGRVQKDRWAKAMEAGDAVLARGLLEKAVATYVKGFETDFRDAYPGVNAVTLMEILGPSDPRRAKLMPVVVYAVERKMAATSADYWDYATLLELAVLAKDRSAAEAHLSSTLAAIREPWEPETTARNLSLIREARARRGEQLEWAAAIEQELQKRT